jgi:hypothetical protein
LTIVPAPRFRGDKFTPAKAGAGMTILLIIDYCLCSLWHKKSVESAVALPFTFLLFTFFAFSALICGPNLVFISGD